MITFLIGLTILIAGAAVYGSICEKVMRPSLTARTPALRLRDGVDFVPMNKWKSCLVELLNIAGTGPVLGPIQGILFGPVAFMRYRRSFSRLYERYDFPPQQRRANARLGKKISRKKNLPHI